MSQIAALSPDLDGVDWQHWLDRWDRQQSGYLPNRENYFDLILDTVERLNGPPRRFLDLACGPGSIASRAAGRFPDAEVVAVDLDPFLLELGRRTSGDRVRYVEADLREPSWHDTLGTGTLDAVCTATALHYLEPSQIRVLAKTLATRIRPGGVFANVDTLRLGPIERPRLDGLAVALRNHMWDGSHARGIEDWTSWWDSARAEPAFAELLAVRDPRFAVRRQGPEITVTETLDAFERAGFAEVGILGQIADKHLFLAIR